VDTRGFSWLIEGHTYTVRRMCSDPALVYLEGFALGIDPTRFELITEDEERPKEPVTSLRGCVREAGGGSVTILIDRDTESYPAPGDSVEVHVLPPKPKKLTAEEVIAASVKGKDIVWSLQEVRDAHNARRPALGAQYVIADALRSAGLLREEDE
jgi:hypothetical protein